MLPECVCIPAGRRLWYRCNELDSRKGCRCSSTFYLGYGFTGQFHGRLASFQQARHVIRNSWVHVRSEEHTSELQSLMRTSSAVFCLTKKQNIITLSTPTILQDSSIPLKIYT